MFMSATNMASGGGKSVNKLLDLRFN